MRHLFVTNDFPPKTGGIESYLLGLCQGLDPADITVVAPARAGHERVDASLPFDVVRVPGTYLRASRRVGQRIVETADRVDADAVHFLHALPLGRLASRVKRATGLPVTVFAHGSEVFVPARLPPARLLLRRIFTRCDLVLAVSAFTLSSVDRISRGRARTAILTPSVDVDRFSLEVSGSSIRERHRLGSRFTVLFVGRLIKRKGAETLIRAMAHAPKAVALIVGSGPEEASLRRVAEEMSVDERIVFAGRIPDDELPAYYAAADAFCMPCSDRYGGLDTEGFGIVYLEAAASGLPCIAGACGGAVEAVDDRTTGIVLDEPTPKVVAGIIRRMEDDDAWRIGMGAAGRRWAERFAPDQMASRFEAHLRDLLRDR